MIALAGGWSGWSAATESQWRNWRASVANGVLSVAATAFLVCLFAALSFVTSGLIQAALPATPALAASAWQFDGSSHLRVVHETPTAIAVIWLLAPLTTAVVMARLININRFSLHAMYRSRLIRAYLGASHEARCQLARAASCSKVA